MSASIEPSYRMRTPLMNPVPQRPDSGPLIKDSESKLHPRADELCWLRTRRRVMPQDPSLFTPSPMEGQGGYNRSSQVQAAGLSPAVPMLELAARTVTLPAGSQPIVIVDYGSSAGHNSLLPLGTAITILRQRIGSDRAISVVHTDLPENDFPVLFETLNTHPNSYLRRDPAVFA